MGAWPEVGHNVGGGSGSSKAALIPNPAEFPCPRYKQLLVNGLVKVQKHFAFSTTFTIFTSKVENMGKNG